MDHEYVTPEQFEIAAANGIPAKNVKARIYVGWSVERAISFPIRPARPDRTEDLKLAAKHGVEPALFYRRISMGWDVQRAATTPKMTAVEAQTLAQISNRTIPVEALALAEANGVCRSTVHTRLRAGWSLEDAVSKPPIPASERRGGANSKWVKHRRLKAK